MTKICVVTKVFAGFYFSRLFLYRLTFLPTIINADFFFTDKVTPLLVKEVSGKSSSSNVGNSDVVVKIVVWLC